MLHRDVRRALRTIKKFWNLTGWRENVLGTARRTQDVRGIALAVDEVHKNFPELCDSDGLKGVDWPCIGMLLLRHQRFYWRIQQRLQYPELPSAGCYVSYRQEISVPAYTEDPDGDEKAITTDERRHTEEKYEAQDISKTLLQCKLNDLVRPISLLKTSSALPVTIFKEKNLLDKDALIAFFIESMRSTRATSGKNKTSCTTEALQICLLNLMLVNKIQEIVDL